MRFRWPQGTVFQQLRLDVELTCCDRCGWPLHVCGHRRHRIYTLQHPLELCCRLAHCSNPACPTRPPTLSPARELSPPLPPRLTASHAFPFPPPPPHLRLEASGGALLSPGSLPEPRLPPAAPPPQPCTGTLPGPAGLADRLGCLLLHRPSASPAGPGRVPEQG